MGKILWIVWAIFLSVMCGGIVQAQITPGTVNSKTDDGVGNKITSTVVGATRGLDVSIIAGGSGGPTYLDADGIANQTASAVHGQTYMYNGVTWDRVRGTIAAGLQVNCVTGCSGGATTPTDAFVNPTTAGLSTSFGMVYNGATWDRMRGTIAGGVLTNISNASLAVTGTFFQAIQPVSGTVAVSNAFLLDATLTARMNTLGQKTMVNSTPVVIASDQSVIPMSVASLPLPAGAATEATLATRLAEATFTGRFAAAYVDADTIANQTTTAMHGQLYGYNGVTWDRLRSTIANGLAVDVTRLTGNVTVIQGTGTNLHVVCDSGCTPGGSFADNAAFTFGTTAINNMGAVVDDTATNTVTENSAGAPRMNTNRVLYGLPTNSTGTALYPSAAVEADAIANPTLTQIGIFMHGYNGATWDRLRSTTANGLAVDVTRVTGNVAVTNAGLTNLDVALSTRLAESTFTGRFVAATLDADALANETTTAVHGKCYLYNGATWDRCRGAVATGLLVNVSNASITVAQGSPPWSVAPDGTIWTLTGSSPNVNVTNTVTVQGAKSNNNTAPGATNVGTLPCIANAAAPTWVEGNQVLCSSTLTGDTRIISKTVTLSTTGQQAVTAVATALPANAGREVCIKVVSSGTQTVFYGIAGVTTATGQEILPGEKFCAPVSNSSQFVVIAGGVGSTISFEVYN